MIAFTSEKAASRLTALPDWQIEDGELRRTFAFEDFAAALAFVNRIGEQAEQVGHHPDIDIRYNRVRLSLVTHDAEAADDKASPPECNTGGLTAKDFDLALIAGRLA
jgi:4a-hydroxytetrahydrobiopterin dehydratase